ncbi:hypothetical protein E2C01_004955 [Portunus trituberculatus]|uniref:Uncharacterized protein n=1 Tax=Portunus trituberculatus TaxID=210409 RepID=A0A5B7CXT5_PORTR|nr:hypothetical protein [Portunus trituberculatus]
MLTRNAASFQTSTCVQHLDKHNPSSLTVQERKELRIVPLVHELLTPSNTVQTYTTSTAAPVANRTHRTTRASSEINLETLLKTFF